MVVVALAGLFAGNCSGIRWVDGIGALSGGGCVGPLDKGDDIASG